MSGHESPPRRRIVIVSVLKSMGGVSGGVFKTIRSDLRVLGRTHPWLRDSTRFSALHRWSRPGEHPIVACPSSRTAIFYH